jgi:hypothetical protein
MSGSGNGGFGVVMRVVLGLVLVAGLGWCGYWFVGASAAERATLDWFAAQDGGPLEAGQSAVSVAGFPNRFDMTIADPRVQDRMTGWGWQAGFLQVFSMTWKPWHLIAAFPQEQQILTPLGPMTLTSDRMQASLVLVPGGAMALDRTALVATAAALDGLGQRLQAAEVRFATRLDPSLPDAHAIGLAVDGLAPDPALMALVPGLPAVIGSLRVDAVAGFSAPLDAQTPQTQPVVERLILQEVALDWGPVVARVTGDLVADAGGLAEGRIKVELTNGAALVPALVAAGLVPPGLAPTLSTMLRRMQDQAGPDGKLTLPMVMGQGVMSLGPLPLGPAPRMN